MKGLHLIILFLIGSLNLHQGTQSDIEKKDLPGCGIENRVFEVGEVITYKIYYNWNFVWLAAGEVTFRVEEENDFFHLSAIGSTYKSYDWFYRVREYYDSYVHKETSLPEISIRKVEEGKYRRYDRAHYYRKKTMAISMLGKTETQYNRDTIEIDPCTHDVLSSVYFLRNLDLTEYPENTRLPIKVYMDRKIYPLTILYKGVEEQKRIKGMGLCNTLYVEPELIVGNIFTEKQGMKVWVSNDENKVPLLIESPVSVGSIKAVLKEHKGLKYPLRVN